MRNSLILFLGILAISSCTKVIDVDLNEANAITVIEANYSAEDSTVRVLVTQTSNYFDNTAPPTIDNAAVTITDHLGNTTVVPYTGAGNYVLAGYVPIFGTVYTVAVVHDGTTYMASSEMRTPIAQLPIYYEYTEGFFGSNAGYIPFVSYEDPAATEDYTLVRITRNDTLFNELNDIVLNDDKLTNGNTFFRPIFLISQVDDSVSLELRTITKEVFNYFTELQSLTDPSSAAPANPEFQWTNDALGFFSAYSSSRQNVIIVE
jgi:hypothetical protein